MNSDTTGSPTDEANVASVLSSWSTHVLSWTRDDNESTCVLRYEDLLAKPAKGFRKLVAFLGLDPDQARIKRAIEFSSFRQMQKQEQAQGFRERSPNSKKFFRAGKQGQWRTTLTKEQVGRLVDAHREQMKRFKYVPPGY